MRRIRLGTILGFALMLAWGCGKESKDYTARINLFHAIPNAGTFRVQVGGESLPQPFGYGLLLPRVAVPALTVPLSWGPSAQPAPDSQFVADFPNGAELTLLFFDSASRYKVAILPMTLPEQPAPNRAFVRVLPMTTNVNSVAVWNDTNRVVVGNRQFGDFYISPQAATFTPVDTGRLPLKLIVNGQLPAVDSVANISLQAGKRYTIYTYGVGGNSGDRRPRMLVQLHE